MLQFCSDVGRPTQDGQMGVVDGRRSGGARWRHLLSSKVLFRLSKDHLFGTCHRLVCITWWWLRLYL